MEAEKVYDKKDEDNSYFERIDMSSTQSRPLRTPKQHKMLIKRIRKIGRMFKPDGISFPEWFTTIRNRSMNLNKEVDMMRRLIRVRKVERLFHLPIDPVIDYNVPKEKAQWKYIKLHFR